MWRCAEIVRVRPVCAAQIGYADESVEAGLTDVQMASLGYNDDHQYQPSGTNYFPCEVVLAREIETRVDLVR